MEQVCPLTEEFVEFDHLEEEYDLMSWVTLRYSRSQISAAGKRLATDLKDIKDLVSYVEAVDIVNNFRAAHSWPMNTFQIRLKDHATQITPRALVVQRLKRLSSIEFKLRRYPKMELARMQDIGGCRAILETVDQVRQLMESYSKTALRHEQMRVTDYIQDPKDSGYRGIHLIYKYYSDKNTSYNGRLIELQFRSQLQHAWATAVETVGTFLEQSLKSSQGSKEWLVFFQLVGSAFAVLEGTPPVPGITTDELFLRQQVKEAAEELNAQATLNTYRTALDIPKLFDIPSDAHYFVLSLTPSTRVGDTNDLAVYPYRKDQLNNATTHYLELEKMLKDVVGAQTVLVGADSLEALKRSYPNYFLDTQYFIESLENFVAGRIAGLSKG